MGYTNKDVSDTIDDVSYLIDELSALRHVIKAVPFQERPTGTDSVYDMLDRVSHAQREYFFPLIKEIFSQPIPVIQVSDYKDTFKRAEDKLSAEELLDEIIQHRMEIMNYIGQLPESEFNSRGKINGIETSILELLKQMVTFERKQLKEIAERVLSIEPKQENRY
jgi:hypothetical protein